MLNLICTSKDSIFCELTQLDHSGFVELWYEIYDSCGFVRSIMDYLFFFWVQVMVGVVPALLFQR